MGGVVGSGGGRGAGGGDWARGSDAVVVFDEASDVYERRYEPCLGFVVCVRIQFVTASVAGLGPTEVSIITSPSKVSDVDSQLIIHPGPRTILHRVW